MRALQWGNSIEPMTAIEWLAGGFVALLLCGIIVRIIGVFNASSQQRSYTGIAIVSGMMIAISVSPTVLIASELVEISRIFPSDFPTLIDGLLTIETILLLLIGLTNSWEYGGLLATLAYISAFTGGLIILLHPVGGLVLIILAGTAMELSPVFDW